MSEIPIDSKRFVTEATERVGGRPRALVDVLVGIQPFLEPPATNLDPDAFRALQNRFWDQDEEMMLEIDMIGRPEWLKSYDAEKLATRAQVLAGSVVIMEQTNATDRHLKREVDRQGDGPTQAMAYLEQTTGDTSNAMLALNAYGVYVAARAGTQLAILSVALMDGTDFAKRYSADIMKLPKGTYSLWPEILARAHKQSEFHQLPDNYRKPARSVATTYKQLLVQDRASNKAYVDLNRIQEEQKALQAVAKEQLQAAFDRIRTDLQDGSDYSRQQHEQLVQPFRLSSKQCNEKNLRPVQNAILRDIRSEKSTLQVPFMPKDGEFARRIVGTLHGLEVTGKQSPETMKEKMTVMLLQEQSLHKAIEIIEDRLSELGEGAATPPSLSEDIDWISRNWSALNSIIRDVWPGRSQEALTPIIAAIECKKAFDKELERDPRQKLYAAARYLGGVALAAETREAVSTNTDEAPSHFKIDDQAAKIGLDELYQATKEINVKQRARVIEHFMVSAAKARQSTGDTSFALYFADAAATNRDRYFIVKCQDAQSRLWYVLESLEGERATYLVSGEVNQQLLGPFDTVQAEIDAVIRNSKTDARDLGALGDYRAQIYHQEDWTPESHGAKVQQHMDAWESSR